MCWGSVIRYILTGCCDELNKASSSLCLSQFDHDKFLMKSLGSWDDISLTQYRSKAEFNLFWLNECIRLRLYCHCSIPVDLREPVPDPINPFVPCELLFCTCSVSQWEVSARQHRDKDHTDMPIQSVTHRQAVENATACLLGRRTCIVPSEGAHNIRRNYFIASARGKSTTLQQQNHIIAGVHFMPIN